MSRLISVFAVFILLSIVGCTEKLSAVRIEYNHEISKNNISDNYASQLFDSVTVTIDKRKNFQMLHWKSLGEKYYLIADKSKQYLLISNESGNYRYEKDEISSRLEGFYFPFEVKKKEQGDTEVAGIKAKNAICMVDSLKGNMIYASEFNNKLPFFEQIPGIPLDFYINVCGENSRFIAEKSVKMRFEDVFIPKEIASFYELTYQERKTPNVNVHGTMEDQLSGEIIPFASVAIFADGEFKDFVLSDCNGNYEMFFDYGKDYMLHFGCKGMVTKIVQLELRNIPTVEDDAGYEMELDGRLFDKIPGVDYSMLLNPIAKATYNSATETIEFDFPYTEKMLLELDKILPKK